MKYMGWYAMCVALTQITQDDCLLQRGSIRMTKREAIRYVAQ